jgi:hypothetical protein
VNDTVSPVLSVCIAALLCVSSTALTNIAPVIVRDGDGENLARIVPGVLFFKTKNLSPDDDFAGILADIAQGDGFSPDGVSAEHLHALLDDVEAGGVERNRRFLACGEAAQVIGSLSSFLVRQDAVSFAQLAVSLKQNVDMKAEAVFNMRPRRAAHPERSSASSPPLCKVIISRSSSMRAQVYQKSR